VSPVHATRALVDVLCELAADADPTSLSVRLAATPAGDLRPTDGALTGVDPETPVLSDFYFPDAGDALTNVFGMDLATPTGQTAGRFASHPDGNPDVAVTDDLHAQLLVAVPPWNPENVRAYDRSGTARELVLVDAETTEPDALG
jgi:proteasome lid subunit RPN8/RPN11